MFNKAVTNIEIYRFQAYTKEAVLWRQLSHPHVLPFYGAFHWSEVPPRLCLVSPWMENGNIVQYLERNPQADRQSLVSLQKLF